MRSSGSFQWGSVQWAVPGFSGAWEASPEPWPCVPPQEASQLNYSSAPPPSILIGPWPRFLGRSGEVSALRLV